MEAEIGEDYLEHKVDILPDVLPLDLKGTVTAWSCKNASPGDDAAKPRRPAP